MLDLPNYIAGKLETSDVTQELVNYKGEPTARIYGVSNAQLRQAKRALKQYTVPLSSVIQLIKHASQYYFSHYNDLNQLAHLTGSPISYLTKSFTSVKQLMNQCDTFLEGIYGTVDYTKTLMHTAADRNVYKLRTSSGPAVAILPRNEEIVAAYVIVQLLLARTPALIKTSSGGASNYTALLLMRALKKAAQELNDTQLLKLLESYSIVNIIEKDKKNIINKLHVAGATYIVFGSNTTMQAIEEQQGTDTHRIVKMGTGFSTSVVLDDAQIGEAAQHICEASAADRGNKCTSTSVCYVHESVYDSFLAQLKKHATEYQKGDPLHVTTKLGVLDEHALNNMKAYAQLHNIPLENPGEELHICEIDEHTHASELDGPLLVVRRINDRSLLEQIKRDLERNELQKNLTTSIFTQSQDRFLELAEQLPTHLARHNIPTTKVNLFVEHQGLHLVNELLTTKTVEVPTTQDLNTEPAPRAIKEVVHGSSASSYKDSWIR